MKCFLHYSKDDFINKAVCKHEGLSSKPLVPYSRLFFFERNVTESKKLDIKFMENQESSSFYYDIMAQIGKTKGEVGLNQDKKSPSIKKVAAAALAVMLGVHTQGAIQEVSAAQTEVSEAAAVSLTDNKIPEGAKISSETAHKNVLKLFPELSKAKLSSVQLGSNNTYPAPVEKNWELSYSVTRGNSTTGFSASVSSQTGEVLQAHLPEFLLLNEESEERISKEKAKEISDGFIQKAIPGLKKDDYTSLDATDEGINPLFGRSNYAFRYQLNVNGLPASGNVVYINIRDTGKVTSYSRSSVVGTYPSPTPKVTQTEAEALFKENLDLNLSYIPLSYGNYGRSSEYHLGYVPSSSGIGSIDAATGKMIDLYSPGDQIEVQNVNEALPNEGVSFNPAAKPLSGDEAVTLVKKHFPWLKEKTVTDVRLDTTSNRGAVQKVWSLRFAQESSSAAYGFSNDISIQVDSETGRVMDYYVWNRFGQEGEKETGKAISDQAARDQATELVLALVPNAAKELKLSQIRSTNDSYSFSFSRYLNGLSVTGDSVNISMKKSGEVTTFYSNLNAELDKLPKEKEPKISVEEATALYLDAAKIVLGYQEYGGYYSSGENVPPTVKLVYMPMMEDTQYYGAKFIDGESGKWREMYSQERSDVSSEAIDISGHQAEAVLERMISHDVLVPNEEGKIEPEQTITKGDWYTYLARAVDPYVETNNYYSSDAMNPFADIDVESPYFTIINRLAELSWVEPNPEENFDPNSQITRGQLSEMIIGMLQYDKLAKFYQQGTDLPNVADASQIKDKGAASLAIRLGILPLVEGRFLPDRPVTVAEAAEVLDRLAELQGKLDYFMNNEWSYRYY